MTVGTQFVRGSNPVWYFVDLVGKQTDGSFYLWTLTNTIPYIPQAVFHDVNGLIPWTDPVEFLANGTLPVDIFFDDTQVYRLEIRQNNGTAPPSQADALIYLAENYIPNGGGGGITPVGAGVISGNQITNGQFVIMNATQPIVLTTGGTTEIAPNWFLDLSGAGMATITQIPLTTAMANPTNAPYALQINSSGWTSPPVLRQRFYQNGMNWQNKTVATSITARIDGVSQNIIVRMIASNGSPVGGVLINEPLTNNFQEIPGNILVPTFANLNLPPNAYIDYQIILPQVGVSYVTSVQVTESATPGNVEYIQDTINRQIDHTFHYYLPKLEYKQVPSYLIGWDFSYNPAQLYGETVNPNATAANQGYYAWDQTIIYQTTPSSTSVARSANGGIQLTCAANGQIALVQYLGGRSVRKILSDKISVHLDLYEETALGMLGNVTLWYTTNNTLPALPATFITGLNSTGVPTGVVSGWSQVPNPTGNTYFVAPTLSATNSEDNDIYLNGWNLASAALANGATYFAIVVGFTEYFSAGPDLLDIRSIGLMSGDIATRPAPKTFAQTLTDCESYYWKTFATNVAPAQAVGINTGEIQFPATVTGNMANYSQSVIFSGIMRTTPTITFYNPASANALARDETIGYDCTSTTALNVTSNGFTISAFGSAVMGGITNPGDRLGVHVVANAQLGVV